MKLLVAIALGGATGALARYFVAQQMTQWLGAGFPWGTFTVNLVGSFVLGLLAETFAFAADASPALRGFLIVGLLGSFTTFSTFSLDVALLFQRDRIDLAALYIAGSVILAIAGLYVGLKLARLALG